MVGGGLHPDVILPKLDEINQFLPESDQLPPPKMCFADIPGTDPRFVLETIGIVILHMYRLKLHVNVCYFISDNCMYRHFPKKSTETMFMQKKLRICHLYKPGVKVSQQYPSGHHTIQCGRIAY